MKFKFTNKKIISLLSIVLVYTIIYGLIGKCNDINQTLQIASSNNTKSNGILNSDTYGFNLDFQNSQMASTEITLKKAGISEYKLFDDFEAGTVPVTTTIGTVAAKLITTAKPSTAIKASTSSPSNPPSAHADTGTLKVREASTGNIVERSVYDVVCKITAQELDATIHPEAVKAQAVAAYTFVLYQINSGVIPTVNFNKSVPKLISDAVSSVVGVAMYYNGQPIYAPYSASTGGATANCSDVWGGYRPYLVSVESKYDSQARAPYYKSTKSLSQAEVQKIIETKTNLRLSDDPSNWFSFLPAEKGGILDGGFVGNMLIDGNSTCIFNGSRTTITGRFIRENLLGLMSSKFEIDYKNGVFTFITYGYGHGVGLSQMGADLYAKIEGMTYDQILKHYYTGVEIR